MNVVSLVVDILFVVLACAIVIKCAKNGFFLSLLSFFKTILAFGAAYLWGGTVGKWICGSFIDAPLRSSIYAKLGSLVDNSMEGLNADSALSVIPEFLRTDAIKEQLALAEAHATAEAVTLIDSLTDTITNAISAVLAAVIGFLVVFLIVLVVLQILYLILKAIRKKLRILSFFDGTLGALFGILLAWAVLTVAASVLKFFFADGFYAESVVVKFLGDSTLLESFRMLDINGWINKLVEEANKLTQ